MRKVTVQLDLQRVMLVDEGIEISHVVDKLDCRFSDTITTANILDTEITDHELIDST